MPGLAHNIQTVDFVFIGALGIIFVIAVLSKVKPLAFTMLALMALFAFVIPPSQTKLLDVQDPNERLRNQQKAYEHGGPTGTRNAGQVLIGVGIAAAVGFLLMPAAKKKQQQEADKIDDRVKNFLGNREMALWETSFNSARIHASQGGIEMAFRSLETSVGAGMDNPDWIANDPKLAALRDRNARRFDKLIIKAQKNHLKNAKKKKA